VASLSINQLKNREIHMTTSRTTVITTSAVVLAALLGATPATSGGATGRVQLAMDDMKPMQQGSSSQSGAGMNQKGMGGGGMMMDDKMKSQQPGMQSQDKPDQPMGGMMMMMEKMMKGMGGGGGMAGMPASPGMPTTGDATDRIEGRIAFLKAELVITDKQMTDWNAFADALRSGRQHLVEARKLLRAEDSLTSTERLERYERHLAERLEAIKTARANFSRLYASLDSSQQRTADEIVVPLIAAF
jgi:hypothetical protein